MKYAVFLIPLLLLMSSCTKTITYYSFKIQSITVNKLPFKDDNGRYFDEDSLVDLSLEPLYNNKKRYQHYNLSPDSLPFVFHSSPSDSADVYSVGATPIYIYDLDDDAVNTEFIGRVYFDAQNYLGKDHFTITNNKGNIELTFSVIWYRQ